MLHFGKNNTHTRYFLNLGNASVLIDNPAFEKDLGTFFQNDYLFDIHLNNIVKRANMLVGLIKRSFSHIDIEMFINLYCTMVRLILEYGTVIWSPTLRKHILKIEAVQRRATKIVHTLKDLSYGDRLIALNLYLPTYRKRRGDLLQVYRMINSIDNITATDFFSYTGIYRTRGHNMRLKKLRCQTNIRKNYFSQRIINDWNGLPAAAVFAASINVLKKEIDVHFLNVIYIV